MPCLRPDGGTWRRRDHGPLCFWADELSKQRRRRHPWKGFSLTLMALDPAHTMAWPPLAEARYPAADEPECNSFVEDSHLHVEPMLAAFAPSSGSALTRRQELPASPESTEPPRRRMSVGRMQGGCCATVLAALSGCFGVVHRCVDAHLLARRWPSPSVDAATARQVQAAHRLPGAHEPSSGFAAPKRALPLPYLSGTIVSGRGAVELAALIAISLSGQSAL